MVENKGDEGIIKRLISIRKLMYMIICSDLIEIRQELAASRLSKEKIKFFQNTIGKLENDITKFRPFRYETL